MKQKRRWQICQAKTEKVRKVRVPGKAGAAAIQHQAIPPVPVTKDRAREKAAVAAVKKAAAPAAGKTAETEKQYPFTGENLWRDIFFGLKIRMFLFVVFIFY
jgi:hypothetical protein